MKQAWKMVVGVALLAAAASPVLAQQPAAPSGNVSVDISDIKADIAKNLNVDANTLPSTVQVPAGVAATACGVGADTLKPGAAACKATSTSSALEQAAKRDAK